MGLVAERFECLLCRTAKRWPGCQPCGTNRLHLYFLDGNVTSQGGNPFFSMYFLVQDLEYHAFFS